MGAVSSGKACLCLLSACPACPCPEPPAVPTPCSPAMSSGEQQLQPCTSTGQPPPAPSSAWFTDLPAGIPEEKAASSPLLGAWHLCNPVYWRRGWDGALRPIAPPAPSLCLLLCPLPGGTVPPDTRPSETGSGFSCGGVIRGNLVSSGADCNSVNESIRGPRPVPGI